MDNRSIAQRLVEYADYLDAEEANPFRVQAYRRAAETVLSLDRPVPDLLAEKGRDGLEALPGIGLHLAYTIEGLAASDEFRTWNGDSRINTERLFSSLPGIGPRLARQIRDQLGIATLEDLEQAAHDGRLSRLNVGPKRVRGIVDAIAGRFRSRRFPAVVLAEPAVADLLAVDQQYRELAEKGLLPTMAPRRFNPNNEAWLPVYQTRHGNWHYRALFSNTARAHELRRTRDWIVLYFQDGTSYGQRTVVTETRGDLQGRRVVRGRERECHDHYRPERPDSPAVPAGAA